MHRLHLALLTTMIAGTRGAPTLPVPESTKTTADAHGSRALAAPAAFVTTKLCLYSGRSCQDGTFLFVLAPAYNTGGTYVVTSPQAFNSVRFCGGANANQIAACAQGFSCYNTRVVVIPQDGNCASANALGSGSLDKVIVSS